MGFFDSGISEGLNQATGTLLHTGMGIMKYNQDKLIQDQTMKLHQEAAERQRIAFERQEAAIKEKEARDNSVVAASQYFPKIREFPSYRQSLIEGFKALNLPYEETPDGDVIGKYGHGQEVLQWIYASGERSEKQAKGVFGDLQNQKMALLQQLQNVKKPEEAKAINDQIAVLTDQQAKVVGSSWDVRKKIEEENAKPQSSAPTENKWIATINDPNATPEEKVVAQQNLDLEQKRKLELARAQGGIKQEQENAGIDIPGIAEAVANGQDSRVAIKNTRGNNVATKVESEVLKKYPKFNFMMADANYKWKSSQTNMRTINYAQGSMQRVAALYEQVAQLKNTSITAINKIMREVSVNLGKPEDSNFESNRNAIVQEVNTALSGSATGSDLRVQIELENLKSARSPKQLQGAITNLYDALFARLDVDLSPIYPIEVVRGEQTMAQYKKELYSKYRSNYKPHNSTDMPAFDVKVPAGTKGFKWENGQLIPY